MKKLHKMGNFFISLFKFQFLGLSFQSIFIQYINQWYSQNNNKVYTPI